MKHNKKMSTEVKYNKNKQGNISHLIWSTKIPKLFKQKLINKNE